MHCIRPACGLQENYALDEQCAHRRTAHLRARRLWSGRRVATPKLWQGFDRPDLGTHAVRCYCWLFRRPRNMNTMQPTSAEAVPIELMSISGAFVMPHAEHGGVARQVTVVAKTIIATAATFFMCQVLCGIIASNQRIKPGILFSGPQIVVPDLPVVPLAAD